MKILHLSILAVATGLLAGCSTSRQSDRAHEAAASLDRYCRLLKTEISATRQYLQDSGSDKGVGVAAPYIISGAMLCTGNQEQVGDRLEDLTVLGHDLTAIDAELARLESLLP